ncbi:5-guanidino-2-oxopentanoate decarboxylase [Roseovarius sp. CAU 1744]|uniref:5-guanidino-2-oxopentanoate decarboxylase n=1 Tax=Roseovarius sp. CAU 1744 TaxID=3140368 RepID=UPI00325BEB50
MAAKSVRNRPLGAQISHMLRSRGVDTIFGIPGVHNQEMYRGIEEAGITHVLARHEQGAGFMADGYARATGKPGVAYVITGPGLCNIMTPMGQAYSDSVPVLVISSCLDETAATGGQLHQMLDQEAAAATVCEWSHRAQDANAVYQLIDRALVEFESGRPRTRHIQVPIRALEGSAAPAPARAALMSARPADSESVAHLADLLRGARRPLFILGGGACGSAPEWRELIETLRAGVFTTYAGRGIIAADYPLSFGAYIGRPESEKVAASADLVVAVGTELSENDLWRDRLGQTCPLVRIDIDPSQFRTLSNGDLGIHADAGQVARGLLRAGLSAAGGWTETEVSAARKRWKAEADAERPGIVRICDALSAALPSDTMYYSDMTQFAYVALEVWDMPKPGMWHHPYGFGTLGYALPASIGGAVARAGQPTVCIAGDYGFQFTVQELGAAVELGLPLPILLWDNSKLGEIEDSMVRSQIAPNAVIAHNPDFCALARAYGARATQPATLEELTAATLAALGADGPTLIYMTPDLA